MSDLPQCFLFMDAFRCCVFNHNGKPIIASSVHLSVKLATSYTSSFHGLLFTVATAATAILYYFDIDL